MRERRDKRSRVKFLNVRDIYFEQRRAKEEMRSSILCWMCGLPLGLNFGTSLGKKLLYYDKVFGNLLLREGGVYVLYMSANVAHIAYRCRAVWHRSCDCWIVRSAMSNIASGRFADFAAPTTRLERFVVLTCDVSSIIFSVH